MLHIIQNCLNSALFIKSHTLHTFRVTDVQLWNATGLSINVIGPSEQRGHALYKPDATGNVKRSISVSVAHQRIGIGLEKILNDLLLPLQSCKMEGRLEGEG